MRSLTVITQPPHPSKNQKEQRKARNGTPTQLKQDQISSTYNYKLTQTQIPGHQNKNTTNNSQDSVSI